MVLAAALAGYSLVYAGGLRAPAALLAGLGLIFVLAAVVFRRPFAVAAGLFALAAEYVLVEVTGHVPTVSLAGYAAGFVVLAEVLLWQGQLPSAARMDAPCSSAGSREWRWSPWPPSLSRSSCWPGRASRSPARYRGRSPGRWRDCFCSPCPGFC